MADLRPQPQEYIRVEAAAHALARAFANGEQTRDACLSRCAHALGGTREWLPVLVDAYLAQYETGTRPRHASIVRSLRVELVQLAVPLALEEAFAEATDIVVDDGHPSPPRPTAKAHRTQAEFVVQSWMPPAASMLPAPAARAWNVPVIETEDALAQWLGLTPGELTWFAGITRRDGTVPMSRLHHYHYRLTPKKSGGVRLIEAPQRRLKALQRTILADILDRVPPCYDAAHGFIKGRSVRTFAAPHVSQRLVLRMDLQDFFPRIGRARVAGIFRTMGYPERVADLLSGICTNAAPRSLFASPPRSAQEVRAQFAARSLYARPHLPQGAPTSPALANLAAFHLDCRLTGLADWMGATYTRYADDLAFSGGAELARAARRFATEVAVIAVEEGWSVQHRKTRIMPRSVRQQLAGVVVNEKLATPRAAFEQLEAVLTNCVRHGAASQNRAGVPDFRAHLRGRVAWVASLNSTRGAKLRAVFDRISW